MEAIPFSGSHSFKDTTTPSESYSFQWKPFPLVEAVRFSGNYFLQLKHEIETILFGGGHNPLAFSGSNSFQWKLLLLIDHISFIGTHSFQLFPKSLCFWCKSLPVIETSLFSRSLFFLVEAWWKLLLLIETFPLVVEVIPFSVSTFSLAEKSEVT